jgi:hypothetical protein
MRRRSDDDDDDRIVEDGESVRCPVWLMDGVQRRVFAHARRRKKNGGDDDDDDNDDARSRGRNARDVRAVTFDAADHQPGYRTDDARYMQAYRRYCTDAGLPHPDADLDATVRDARAARSRWIADMSEAWRGPQRDMNPAGGFTCPECHGTGIDPDGDSPDGRCDECAGVGYIETPNVGSSFQRRDPGRAPDPDLRMAARGARSTADTRAAATAEYYRMCARLRDAWRTPVGDFAEPDMGTRPEDLELMRRHLRTESSAGAQARRDRAWTRYRDDLQNAWKNPPGVIHPQPTKVASGPSGFVAAVESPDPAARAAAIQRQGEKWRFGA